MNASEETKVKKDLKSALIGLVIAVANKKGGVGKTTFATILAHRIGAALVDLDPQGNAADWAEGCNHPHYRLGVSDVSDDQKEAYVEDMAKKVIAARELGPVVIDCPPGENFLFRVALGVSSGVVIPFKPGAADMKAVIETACLIRDTIAAVNPDLRIMVLQNEARLQDTQGLTGLTLQAIKTALPTAKLVGSLANRKIYPIAYSANTVPNSPKTDEELGLVFQAIGKALGVRL